MQTLRLFPIDRPLEKTEKEFSRRIEERREWMVNSVIELKRVQLLKISYNRSVIYGN